MKLIPIIILLVTFLKSDDKSTLDILFNESCAFNGKKLYGKIKLVEYASDADIKVKIVSAFPDLKVKFVENFADDCGEWQIVENNEDLKVYITESFPDLKIQPVVAFPGLSN